jgi:hypothetical protein
MNTHAFVPATLGQSQPLSSIYGQPAVKLDEIVTAVIELPELMRLAKWYGIGLGVLLVYVAVQVSKR